MREKFRKYLPPRYIHSCCYYRMKSTAAFLKSRHIPYILMFVHSKHNWDKQTCVGAHIRRCSKMHITVFLISQGWPGFLMIRSPNKYLWRKSTEILRITQWISNQCICSKPCCAMECEKRIQISKSPRFL